MIMFLQQNFAGINWIEDEGAFTITLRGSPVTVIFDGSYCRGYDKGSHDFLSNFQMFDISQIDVIPSPWACFWDPLAGAGIIAITTKTGDGSYNAKWNSSNLKYTIPLGYQPSVEFYVPRYDFTAEKEKKEQDLRTTIHWQPRLQVKNGKANIDFYTADGAVDYTVVIEGVGEDGSLLRVEENIK